MRHGRHFVFSRNQPRTFRGHLADQRLLAERHGTATSADRTKLDTTQCSDGTDANVPTTSVDAEEN